MNLILMGTNDWVVPIFERVNREHNVVAVFTRAPKPAGRKKVLTPSPVHIWAETNGIPVYTDINDIDNLVRPEFILVASYGVILKQNVLDFATRGIINIHPSNLPKYRGPSPMLTAVYNGDESSAVCLMNVSMAVDAGDLLMCENFDIGIDDTVRDVESRVSGIASDMVSEYLKNPEKIEAHPQKGTPTFTRKFNGPDEIIDWSRGAVAIHNQVRSIGARTRVNGIDVKILKTRLCECDAGLPVFGLEILTIQPSGKKAMQWRDFLNGQRGEFRFE